MTIDNAALNLKELIKQPAADKFKRKFLMNSYEKRNSEATLFYIRTPIFWPSLDVLIIL